MGGLSAWGVLVSGHCTDLGTLVCASEIAGVLQTFIAQYGDYWPREPIET